jgi:hypothetical protein
LLNESALLSATEDTKHFEGSAALCASEGAQVRRHNAHVVEVMLYSYEADHLLMKLLELILVQVRSDYNLKRKPLSYAIMKHHAPLRRCLHVIDLGKVECYDDGSPHEARDASYGPAHSGQWDRYGNVWTRRCIPALAAAVPSR